MEIGIIFSHRVELSGERDDHKCYFQKYSPNHLWLQLHPLIVFRLNQVRPILTEGHRDSLVLGRVNSELGWMYGRLRLYLPA